MQNMTTEGARGVGRTIKKAWNKLLLQLVMQTCCFYAVKVLYFRAVIRLLLALSAARHTLIVICC